jgi:hypothetical protein
MLVVGAESWTIEVESLALLCIVLCTVLSVFN